jgi:mono/diheme cytochrome c family protein
MGVMHRPARLENSLQFASAKDSVAQLNSFSRLVPFFAILVGLALAGCRAKPELTPEQEEGKRVYAVGCAHCHEENDLGLKKVPPDLHGLFNKSKLPDGAPATDAEVEQVLMKGKGMMPSFAYQMSREQMAAVIAYLHAGVGR